MKITVRLTVLKDKSYVKTPHFSTPRGTDDPSGYYCTTGVGPGELALDRRLSIFSCLMIALRYPRSCSRCSAPHDYGTRC